MLALEQFSSCYQAMQLPPSLAKMDPSVIAMYYFPLLQSSLSTLFKSPGVKR